MGIAQKSRLNGFELISEPFKDSTYDWCATGLLQLPNFHIRNYTNDTIRDYSNGMGIYYVLDSNKTWKLIGNDEILKLFDLCKSSEFNPLSSSFSEDNVYKIKSVKRDMSSNHRIINTGVNECCFDKLKYPFTEFLNMEKDTSYKIRLLYRKPISKNKYLQVERKFILSNKFCFDRYNEEKKLSKSLDSIAKLSGKIALDKDEKISYTLQFIKNHSNALFKEHFYIQTFQIFYYKRPERNIADSNSYRAFIKNAFFNDTAFANVIRNIPTERQAFWFLDRTLPHYLTFFKNDYEEQVNITIQALKLLSKNSQSITRYIPIAYDFTANYIKVYKEPHRKGEVDERVVRYVKEIYKK